MGQPLDELRETLDEAGVPSTAYAFRSRLSLRRPADGTWCVQPTLGDWQVYQWSGGAKRHLTEVSTEQGACDVLLGELGLGYLHNLRAE